MSLLILDAEVSYSFFQRIIGLLHWFFFNMGDRLKNERMLWDPFLQLVSICNVYLARL